MENFMKKLLSLFVLSCAIVANEEIPMFPTASDTCETYAIKFCKNASDMDAIIKDQFSYFRPSTWFKAQKPLSPEQVQLVRDYNISHTTHPLLNSYSLQLLHQSTLPTISLEEHRENINSSIKKGLDLAQFTTISKFEPSLENCLAVRDAFIFLTSLLPEETRYKDDSKFSLEEWAEGMSFLFRLLEKCSKEHNKDRK
jgi:hypothetical protein